MSLLIVTADELKNDSAELHAATETSFILSNTSCNHQDPFVKDKQKEDDASGTSKGKVAHANNVFTWIL